VDGIALLEWLHDRQPETRFILLTGFGNAEVEQKVRELGAFDYLNKPISPDTLAAVVTAATHLKLIPSEPAPETPVVEAVSAAVEPEPVVAVPDTQKPKGALRRSLEIVTGLVVAPLLGLAFVVFLPVIGFGALFWMLGESLWNTFKPAAT
jgi:ActR/RegA family two-component response regulator